MRIIVSLMDMHLGQTFPLCPTVDLQRYILICCQHEIGGLKDKPEKSVHNLDRSITPRFYKFFNSRNPDFYHTCYCLSGLSVAQHEYSWDGEIGEFLAKPRLEHVLGVPENLLVRSREQPT